MRTYLKKQKEKFGIILYDEEWSKLYDEYHEDDEDDEESIRSISQH